MQTFPQKNRLSTGIFTLALLGAGLTQSAVAQGDVMQITITRPDNGQTAVVDLNDSAAAKSFADALPITVEMRDYGKTEKIADLAVRLNTQGAPAGYTPETGDFSYFAPWGNLAIFRQPFRYSPNLIKLGEVQQGMDLFNESGSFTVEITLSF